MTAAEDSAVRRSLQAVEGQASEVRRALQALRTQVDGLGSANRWASVVFKASAFEQCETKSPAGPQDCSAWDSSANRQALSPFWGRATLQCQTEALQGHQDLGGSDGEHQQVSGC